MSKKLVSIVVTICMVMSSLVMPTNAQKVKAAEFTSETIIQNGFSLTIQQSTDTSQRISSQTLEMIKEVYFKQYPKMRARYNPARPRAVVMKFDPDYDGVAYTGGDMGGAGIKFSVNYLKSQPNDADCATHELFHVVQGGYMNYNSESFEGAICEGIADYARSVYGLYNDLQGWWLGNYDSSQTILTRYASNARFLTWISQHKNTETTYMLNKTMHNGSYTADMWVQLTGMTSDELWNAYASNPNIDTITLDAQKGETFGITSGETYKIISSESGLAVSVQNGSTDEGANIQQENYTGDDSQHWILNYVGNGQYNIINKKSGKGWDVVNGGTTNGTNIAQYNVSGSGNNNQKWVLFERGGTYAMFPVVGNGSMVADLSSSSHNPGANIQLWGWNKSKAQGFIIEPVSGSNIDGSLKPFDRIEAEDFVTYSTNIGVAIDENDSRSNGGNIGGLLAGAWTRYSEVEFDSDASSIELTYCNPSYDSYVNIYVGSMSSTPVAVVQTPNNSSDWNTYTTVKADLTTNIPAGTYDIYLEFKNAQMSSYTQNLDYFKFNRAAVVSDGLTECTLNANTLVGEWGYYVGDWAAASARYAGGTSLNDFTLKVTASNGSAWGVQAFTKNIAVNQGSKYTVMVTLNSDKAGANVLFKDDRSGTIFEEKALVAGDNVFTGTYTATGNEAAFFFDLGAVAAGTTLKVTSFSLTEEAPAETTVPETTTQEIIVTDWQTVDNSNGVYSYRNATKVEVVNVQQPGFASSQGIYITTNEAIGSIKMNDVAVGTEAVAIQGAGAIVYLTAIPTSATKVDLYSTTGALLGSIEFKKNPEAETTTEAPTEEPTEEPTTEAPTEEPTTEAIKTIEGGIEINGYQISATAEGTRTVYSVDSEIDGKKVVSSGIVYSLADYVEESELYVGSTSEYVRSYASTTVGVLSRVYSDSDLAKSYAMTMKFGPGTHLEFNANWRVRAYAQLEDGTYVYTNAYTYKINDIADELYQERKMNTKEYHDYLYNKILKVVNKDYEMVDYNWNNSIVG